jgi:hypothetical protein
MIRMGWLLRYLLRRYLKKLAASKPGKIGQEMVDCGEFLLIEDGRGSWTS